MKKLSLTFFFIYLNAIECLNDDINRFVRINDIITLNCNENDTIKLNNSNNQSIGFEFYVFKQDNIIVNLNNDEYQVNITDKSKLGVYECGIYQFNKYGSFQYEFGRAWILALKIEGMFF
jgi:hypothetical protein